jgi:hypothetical protein
MKVSRIHRKDLDIKTLDTSGNAFPVIRPPDGRDKSLTVIGAPPIFRQLMPVR